MMRLILFNILLIVMMISCTEPKDDPIQHSEKWVCLGLEEEDIISILIDPTDHNILYAGSASDFSRGHRGGLFKSIDLGVTWDTVLAGVTVIDMVFHPTDHNTLFVLGGANFLTPWGIFKTENSGNSWARIDSGLILFPNEGPWTIALDPVNPDNMLVGTGGMSGGNVYASVNSGISWQPIGNQLIQLAGANAIAINPQETDMFYIGTSDIGAILKTINGGETWNRLTFPEVGIIHDLDVHPGNPDVIYAGTWHYGFFRSQDEGVSWESCNQGLLDTTSVREIIVSPDNSIIIAANDMYKGAIYRSPNDSISWTMVDTSFSGGVNTISLSNHGELYLGKVGIYLLTYLE